MIYKVIKQSSIDDRVFTLQDVNGNSFDVDFYSGGGIDHPEGVEKTPESWSSWLKTFIGKELEIEKIVPYIYFSIGEVKVV
jgi:hypothetical protein